MGQSIAGRFGGAVLLAVSMLFAVAAMAQPIQSASRPVFNLIEITLGQSVVPLYGPWKFTVGDSPVDPLTKQPLWAEPEFDDSQWGTVDLTPRTAKVASPTGTTGYVPGWGALGHAGYSGYGWYRIRVHVHVPHGERLALAGPNAFDDAYQVFQNGALLGDLAVSTAMFRGTTMPSLPSFHWQMSTARFRTRDAGM